MIQVGKWREHLLINRGGFITNEKIYNPGEWFEFDNLKLGLNNKFNGFGITKVGTTETGSDAGSAYGVGGNYSNYEQDLFEGTNHSSKGMYYWLGFFFLCCMDVFIQYGYWLRLE